MDPSVPFLVIWVVVIVPGFFVLLYRVTRNKRLFARMAPGYMAGAAAFLAAFLLRSGKWSLLLAGLGAISIGLDLLLFREAWALFNRRIFGSIISWHRSETNSRLLVLVLGVAACGWGIAAAIAALTRA